MTLIATVPSPSTEPTLPSAASPAGLVPLGPVLTAVADAALAGHPIAPAVTALGLLDTTNELLATRALARHAAATAGHDALIPALTAQATLAALAAL